LKTKFATPRQAQLAPNLRGILTIYKKFHPQLSLEGLNQYSHLWLISAFHEHLELPFRPLHSPPRLLNEKVGAFSARSPHRPIGLSLSKIHHVDIWKGQIHLRGLDLIDETPILDIKTVVPLENLEFEDFQSPKWVQDKHITLPVEFSSQARESLHLNLTKRKDESQFFYKKHDVSSFENALVECLQLDPRPALQKKRRSIQNDYAYSRIFVFDGLEIDVSITNICLINDIYPESSTKAS